MAKRETRLPALTTLDSIKEALDVRLGRRGDKLDKAVTFRDLEKSGAFKAGFKGGDVELTVPIPGGGGEGDRFNERTVPNVPHNFRAFGIFGGIHIIWSMHPSYHQLVQSTEVYRATTNNAADRELLTVSSGSSYLDPIDNADQQEYFYWVRFISLWGVYSPFAGPESATVQPLVSDIMERISGEINEDVLDPAFRDRLNGFQETISEQGDRYTMTVTQDGKVAGMSVYNDAEKDLSTIAFLADRFVVANELGAEIHPFIIDEQGRVMMDTALISDAYITEAVIGNVTFNKIEDDNGRKITSVGGKLKVDYIEVSDIQIDGEAQIKNGTITNAKIANVIQSDNFSSGSRGWQIRKDGNAEFNSVDFRGLIDFDDLRVRGNPVNQHIPVALVGEFGASDTWTTVWRDLTILRDSTQTGHVTIAGSYKFWGRILGTIRLQGSGPSNEDNSYSASYRHEGVFEYNLQARVYLGGSPSSGENLDSEGNPEEYLTWKVLQQGQVSGLTGAGTLRETGVTTDSDGVSVDRDFWVALFGTLHVGERVGNFTLEVRMDVKPSWELVSTPLTDGNPYCYASPLDVEHVEGALSPMNYYFKRF